MKQPFFGRELTRNGLERQFWNGYYTKTHGWRLPDGGTLRIDLSGLRYVEFGAAVQLVLFAEAVVAIGGDITVIMPGARVGGRQNRGAAALSQLGFAQALTAPHFSQYPGTVAFQGSRGEQTEADGPSGTDGPLRLVLPMTWISDPRESDGRTLVGRVANEEFLSKELITHPSGRVSLPDAEAIGHIILKELAENTADHSGRHHALFAAWARSPRGAPTGERVRDIERAFLAAAEPFPVVELIVGDSGVGVPTTLEEAYGKRPSLPGLTREESVLAWAFERESSGPKKPVPGGTRGLFRVERFAHKYHGLVSMRSSRSEIAFDGSLPAKVLSPDTRLSVSPGTVVHLRIPVARIDHVVPGKDRPEPAGAPTPVWVDLPDFVTESSVEDLDQTLQHWAARDFPRNERAVFIDFAGQSLDRRRFEITLRWMMSRAVPTFVAAVDVGDPGLDAIQQAVNSIQYELSQTRDLAVDLDAVLVRHTSGRDTWCAPTAGMAAVLTETWHGVVVPLEALMLGQPDRESWNIFVRSLREQRHALLEIDSAKGVRASVNQADIDHQVHRSRREELIGSLDRSRHVDRDGPLVTPTLRVVERFINTRRWVQDLRLDVAANELSRKLSREAGAAIDQPHLTLAAALRSSDKLMRALRRALRRQPGVARVDAVRIGPTQDLVVAPGTPVILACEIIESGSSIRRLAGTARRCGAEVQIILTLLDARPDTERGPVGGVDIIGLAQVPLGHAAEPELSMDTISPVTLVKESPADDSPRYPIGDDEFSRIVADSAALTLGHVVRPTGRHFAVALDPERLLGIPVDGDGELSASGSRVVDVLVAEASKVLEDQASAAVVYPGEQEPTAARRLAEEIGVRLGLRVAPLNAIGSVVPKDDLFDTALPRHALLVDVGALTGSTLRRNFARLADLGVERTTALIAVSSLPPTEERFLRGISFGGPQGTYRAESVFAAQFPIRPYRDLDCPHCRQLRRWDSELRGYPAVHFESHVERARGRRLPVYLPDPRDGDRDGLRYVNTREEVASIMKWGRLLGRMPDSTRARLRAYHQFQEWLQDEASPAYHEADLALELLAAEWTVLSMPAMNSERMRAVISRLAAKRAISAKEDASRIAAMVVLRSCSRRWFRKLAPELWSAAAIGPQLADQLLYGTFTHLQRRYVTESEIVEIQSMLDGFLEDNGGALVAAQANSHGTIHALKTFSHARLGAARARGVTSSKQASWSALRGELLGEKFTEHGERAVQAASVLNVAPLRGTRIDTRKWRVWGRDWAAYVPDFLLGRLAPHLAEVRPIVAELARDEFRNAIGIDLILDADALAGALANMAESLSALAAGPAAQGQLIRRVAGSWAVIWHTFFDRSGDETPGSTLHQILRPCPSNLREAVFRSEAIMRARAPVGRLLPRVVNRVDPEHGAFVHGALLDEIILELLRNTRHARPHPVENEPPQRYVDSYPGGDGIARERMLVADAIAPRVRIDFESTSAAGLVTLSAKTRGIVQRQGGTRQGIPTMERVLAAHGASVSVPPAPGMIAHQIKLTFSEENGHAHTFHLDD